MTEVNTTPEGEVNAAGSTNAVPPELQALIDAIKSDPTRTAQEIKNLRAEAKANREKADAAEAKRKADELKALEANNQWKEAADAYKLQLDELAPKAQRVEEVDQLLKEMVERRTAQLQPHLQTLVASIPDPRTALAWLDENAGALNLPKPPSKTGAGEQGDAANTVPKSVQEKLAQAKAMGMSPEQLAQMQAFLTKQSKQS